MFSIFKKTDKYYFEEIQKKQKQVNKLNEDIKTMAKLALRDGKLQPSTEEQVSNVQQPQQQEGQQRPVRQDPGLLPIP